MIKTPVKMSFSDIDQAHGMGILDVFLDTANLGLKAFELSEGKKLRESQEDAQKRAIAAQQAADKAELAKLEILKQIQGQQPTSTRKVDGGFPGGTTGMIIAGVAGVVLISGIALLAMKR